ncbi:DNA cytosine methyltransferase [Verrucosispora sp. WMMA2044]|uniref:DNA cytosine methyltransferase n=1 Tax=Verrucosispora sp. WMMA2044 TaxID=3016419 RepID=UPI00248C5003|nr:DNA cytosine methyltransferase [Verrucosispora sp. WMMA2044]WBB47435.1 DNA cytosine methyltransferase [Verrucosispora sp. WMMA2044]
MHTVVDLFAGCGGGSMGFKKAGFKTLAAIEIDVDAAAAFALNVGVKPIVKDIRDVSVTELQAVGVQPGELTLLFGCPPCQSFTVLRRGSAASDHDLRRNSLIFEYLRLVEALQPRHIAFENVPGLVGGRWSEYFEIFRERLDAMGYRIAWDVIDAADYGVPQRRRRVLVIGSRVTEPQLPEPTHGSKGDKKPYATVRQAIYGLPPLAPAEADPHDPFHKARRHSKLALRRLARIPEGGGRADLPEDLVLNCHKNHNGHYDIYGRMWWDRVAPTLTSGCTNVTRGRFAHPEQDRAITLREAMLLQTFPRKAHLHGTHDAMALQVGNAVPSLLAERIATKIMGMERQSLPTSNELGKLEGHADEPGEVRGVSPSD